MHDLPRPIFMENTPRCKHLFSSFSHWFEGVQCCRASDSLFSVLEAIVKAEKKVKLFIFFLAVSIFCNNYYYYYRLLALYHYRIFSSFSFWIRQIFKHQCLLMTIVLRLMLYLFSIF
uniref:Uncharacterized protein n=1 Tax=Heterorhabditis bacteriophora TaxID=37862 RepID=A0A1I7WPG7_HETBA